MKVFDITLPLREGMQSYPGEPGPVIRSLKSIEAGRRSNVSLITITTHAGTHVDAPRHFFSAGGPVDQIPPGALVGPAQVVEIDTAGQIGVKELEDANILRDTSRVLFKTRNGELWQDPVFRQDYAGITHDGASWLVNHGLRLVGIDYLSVEPFGAAKPDTHRTLLGAGVVVLEGVDLREVAPGIYTLVCLPLRIEGGDGSPVRALLIEPLLADLDLGTLT